MPDKTFWLQVNSSKVNSNDNQYTWDDPKIFWEHFHIFLNGWREWIFWNFPHKKFYNIVYWSRDSLKLITMRKMSRFLRELWEEMKSLKFDASRTPMDWTAANQLKLEATIFDEDSFLLQKRFKDENLNEICTSCFFEYFKNVI